MSTTLVNTAVIKGGKLSLGSLYGLRGLAALAIVLFHFVPNVNSPVWVSFIPNYFGSAVQLFFVLSAFSLCYTTSSYVGSEGWVDRYFWKRFFRIVPPFWVVLAFFTIHDHYQWGLSFFEKTLVANILLIFNFIPGKHESSVMAGWTIGVEVIFYAFFPMLVLLIRSLKRAVMLFILSAIALVVGRVLLLQTPELRYEHNSFITNMVYFAAGILAYWVFRSSRHLSMDRRFIFIAAISVILLLFGFLWPPIGLMLQSVQAIGAWLAVTFGCITVWVALRPNGVFSWGPLVWCGMRSYSIYLVHAVIVWRLTPVYGWIYAQGSNSDISFVLCMIVALTSVLLFAEIFHQLVELPSIRIGKRFESSPGSKWGALFTGFKPPLSVFFLWAKRLESDWPVKLLAVGVAVFASYIALRFSGQPLLESYGFRQTQTALTAFWMLREGWQLGYQTPVAGYPWAIPFEFPIYQAIAAMVAWIGGFSLDPVGRLLSFVFLLACAWPAFAVVRRMRLPTQIAWVFCALLWSSPIYLFYGRTFMIETAAIFFAFAAIPFALDICEHAPRWRSVLMFSIFATLAALQKITTGGPVILVMGCLWLVAWWSRGGLRLPTRKDIITLAIAFGIPIFVAYSWVVYSDVVKSANLFGADLISSKLSDWNFGTLDQRLNVSTYKAVFWDRGFALNAGSAVGLSLILCALVTGGRRYRGIIFSALILFVLPVMIFTNLHIVHNYYQVGCMLFLIFALSVAVAGWLPTVVSYSPIVPVLAGLLVANNFYVFGSGYGTVASRLIVNSSNSPHERALIVGEAVRRYTPLGSGIVVLGNDWDSDIAYYSQRKSFTVPDRFNRYDQVLAQPSHFLGNLPLGAIVICPDDKAGFKGPTVDERSRHFDIKEWIRVDVQACRLWLPRNPTLVNELSATSK